MFLGCLVLSCEAREDGIECLLHHVLPYSEWCSIWSLCFRWHNFRSALQSSGVSPNIKVAPALVGLKWSSHQFCS